MIKKLLLALFILGLTIGPQSSRAATVTFSDMQAVISITANPLSGANRILSLLVDETLFGPGSFAGGNAGITNGVFVDLGPVQWQVVGGSTPDDGTPAINFIIDSDGDVIDDDTDSKSIALLTASPTGAGQGRLFEFDFAGLSGSVGSLNLAGIVLHELNTSGDRIESFNVNPFTIQAVPIPAAVWLFATALIGLVGICKRRKTA